MPVKIRLSRHGKKKSPYYHIVIADGRAPRDGKFIERIGNYDPTTNPATIKLNFDRALEWLNKGAQPTDTCRAILSYEGVLYKQHLLGGVKKGAFDEATAETKFESWKTEKLAKIQSKKDRLLNESSSDLKKRLEEEAKVNSKRSEAIAERNAKLVADERAKKEEEQQAKEAKVAELEAQADQAKLAERAEEIPTSENTEAIVEQVETVVEVQAENQVEELPVVETTEKVEAVESTENPVTDQELPKTEA